MEKNINEAIKIIEDVRRQMPGSSYKEYLGKALNKLNEASQSVSIDFGEFFVVARTSDENWTQLSIGLPDHERALGFKNEPFIKERYRNAFVVCRIK